MRNSLLSVIVYVLLFSLEFPASGSEVYVGAALPLSGANAEEGRAMRQALELFVRNHNQDLGNGDHRLVLVVKDDGNSVDLARRVAEAFAEDDRIVAVIGHEFSEPALAASEVYDKKGPVLISPSASNPKVTRSSPWVFSMNYDDQMQGENIAIYLNVVMKAKQVAVVHSSDAYGTGLLKRFAAKAPRVGLDVVKTIDTSQTGRSAADLLATSLGQEAVDELDAVVVFAHNSDGAQIVSDIRTAGYDCTVIGPDAFAKQSFIDAVGRQADNVLVASPFLFELASLETRQFAAEYRAATGTEPTQWSAFCYDAALLLGRAVAEEGKSREAIRKYLADLNEPERAQRGITGKLQFDEHGNIRRPILISRIHKGRFQPAFIQLRPVTSRHVLNNLDAEVQADHVQVCDGDPYYLSRIVYTGLDFYRINYVDISGQSFDAEFFLWFRWMGDVELVESIDFLNGIHTEEDLKEIVREDRTGPVNYICYKVKGRFLTPYDLREFPFDTQRLPMTLSHRSLDADRVLLVVDSENLSSSTLAGIYPEEWTYVGREDYAGTHVLNSTFGDPSYVGETSEVEFSIYQTNIVIQRIIFPFLVKLFLPMAIMITVSVLVLLIPTQQFDARIGLVMTALLSLIVFHLSQSESLPSVGYLVKADQYFMVSYVLMFTLILNTITVNILVRRESPRLARKLDRWFAAIVIPVAAVVLLVLTVTAWI